MYAESNMCEMAGGTIFTGKHVGEMQMGAWGSSLYANDTTSDVRDTYMEFLKDQMSNHEAYSKTLKLFRDYVNDPDEAPLFWYALADTQWQVGRLTPEVKENALEWIKKGGGLRLWEESKTGSSGWQKTLDKLHERLKTEQRKEKKISKRIEQNLWNIGDVYAYQFHTEESAKYEAFGKYMLLQKIDAYPHSSDTDLVMCVHVFDKLFDKIPDVDDLTRSRLLPFGFPNYSQDLRMNSRLVLLKKRDYPEAYLTFLGNMNIPANTVRKYVYNSDGYWNSIESWSMYFQCWQNVEYETVEEGVFRYVHSEVPHC